jgi:hypothetical protein
MTVRPMVMSLPPEAEWVDVGCRNGGSVLEVRLPWQVFQPDPGRGADAVTPGAASDLVQTSLGLDLDLAMTNLARKHLFAPEVIDRQDQAAAIRTAGGAASIEQETSRPPTASSPKPSSSAASTPRAAPSAT